MINRKLMHYKFKSTFKDGCILEYQVCRYNVVAETDSSGAIESEILWGNGKPIARKTNGSWYYYIYNAHGDVIGLVSEAGDLENTYEYDAWGNITIETESVDNPIKYAGEYYDDELGMYYLRARYYNPSVKRFTSYDIKEGEILNPPDMDKAILYVHGKGYNAREAERYKTICSGLNFRIIS